MLWRPAHRATLRAAGGPARLVAGKHLRCLVGWPESTEAGERVPLPWSPGATARGDGDGGESTRQRKVSNAIEQQLRKTLLSINWAKRMGPRQAVLMEEVFDLVELESVTISGDMSVATVCWRPADVAAGAPEARTRPVGRGWKKENLDEYAGRILHRAAGLLRQPVGRALSLRHVPMLKFTYDGEQQQSRGKTMGKVGRKTRGAAVAAVPVADSFSAAFAQIANEAPLIQVKPGVSNDPEIPSRPYSTNQ